MTERRLLTRDLIRKKAAEQPDNSPASQAWRKVQQLESEGKTPRIIAQGSRIEVEVVQ